MRLLNTYTMQLDEFFAGNVPPYAILSHTWTTEEVTFQDLQRGVAQELEGYAKVRNLCRLAAADGLQWAWIDNCCIDKNSSAELSEAINSMYKWYENAEVCYVYLVDVSTSDERQLRSAKWFTRGWALQELVAPRHLMFHDCNWHKIGTRADLSIIVSDITGIEVAVLLGSKNPKDCLVSERMAWAAHRETIQVEDQAYCLMGLFDIAMPIIYGEGINAFRRLQEEINKAHSSLDSGGMRLLVATSDPLEFKNVNEEDDPRYAILSHTWGSEEVSFADVLTGNAKRRIRSYRKIRNCCKKAVQHGFEYLWVDTCCIDKSSSAELQEAICSMYKWYKNAQICYVYLEDSELLPEQPCRWFRRGWTLRESLFRATESDTYSILEELIAPNYVEFYDTDWNEIGTKISLCDQIAALTGIDPLILRGADPIERTIAERMSWASSRVTTRTEDMAYCLMGLFNVFMPMLYGEGSRAFLRLQEEILRNSEDYTIFAWEAQLGNHQMRGLFARSPAEFLRGGRVIPRFRHKRSLQNEPIHPATVTSRGIHINLPLMQTSVNSENTYLAWVSCMELKASNHVQEREVICCIWLLKYSVNPTSFLRINPEILVCRPRTEASKFGLETIYVLPWLYDQSSALIRKRAGMIRVHSQPGARVYASPASTSKTITGNLNGEVSWNSDSSVLSYRFEEDPCALSALVVESTEIFVVIVGFRNDKPWCSIITYPGPEAFESLNPGTVSSLFESVEYPYNDLTDRAKKTLPSTATISTTIRPGRPTRWDPNYPYYFNLHIHYHRPQSLLGETTK